MSDGSVPQPPRALVLGAVSRDLARPDASDARPGGVVVHAGEALARLGARTRVVTRVRGEDAAALLAPLEAAGVEIRALPSRTTTTYVNDYSTAIDRHVLLAASESIRPEDVPIDWRAADLVQLGPLHPMDVLPETVAVLSGLRGIDLQGLVRVPGVDGASLRAEPILAALLAHVDVVQVSEHELPAVLSGESLDRFVARHAIDELIVTRGARGATVLTRGEATEVPAAPAVPRAKVGAGDVFLATYLVLRVRGAGPVAAACEAARTAALKVEHGGIAPRRGRS